VPQQPRLTEHDNGRGGKELVLESSCWCLRVDLGEQLDPHELRHLASGRYLADESYCYQVTVTGPTASGYHGGPLSCRGVEPLDWSLERDASSAALVLLGQLDFGPAGPTGLRLEHRITLAASGEVAEQLTILHHAGHDHLQLSDIRFAFRKTLFDRSRYAWRPGADTAELIPVPLRRHAGQGTDHLLDGYRAYDLFPEEWTRRSGLPGRSSEAWLWQEDGGGFLVAKYNQDHIEFSVADADYVTPRSSPGREATLHLARLHSDRNCCLRLGGAGVSRGCPEHAAELHPRQRVVFGSSVVAAYEGDWQAGFATYKELLRRRGHVLPAGYAPKVHWNELYRLGWRCGSNAPLQELPELFDEAARAKAAGAQAFYFDPGWDLYEGSAVWDVDRLGPLESFLERLRNEFGLELSLHLMIHTKSLEEDAATYRRRRDGEIDLWHDATPYVGGYVCPASPVWQRQKMERLRRLAAAGVSFFMFDFVVYEEISIEPIDHAGDALRTCWSPGHGHRVPLSREEHADGIMAVIRALKREFPEVVIEAHDRVGAEFLPLYYQHGPRDAHDELWGFEYMWDPYTDLLSGKALSLYGYNLAYDIPLYLHVNCAHDSPSMLAFWWYASCCRHLGIGGLAEDDEQWPRLVGAMRRYRRLQAYFARGRFVGLDVLTHLHVLDDGEGAVLTAYNLAGGEVRRRVSIPPTTMRLAAMPQVRGAPATMEGGSLLVDLVMPPLSPAVIEIDVGG
jgi:hypothetical protein